MVLGMLREKCQPTETKGLKQESLVHHTAQQDRGEATRSSLSTFISISFIYTMEKRMGISKEPEKTAYRQLSAVDIYMWSLQSYCVYGGQFLACSPFLQ